MKVRMWEATLWLPDGAVTVEVFGETEDEALQEALYFFQEMGYEPDEESITLEEKGVVEVAP